MSLLRDENVKLSSSTCHDTIIPHVHMAISFRGCCLVSVKNDKSGVVLVSSLQGEMESVQFKFVLEENTQCLSMKYGQF